MRNTLRELIPQFAPNIGPLLAVLLLAGCGGGESRPAGAGAEQRIRATVEAYSVGVWENDHERACAQLTEEAIAGVLASATAKKLGIDSCRSLVDWVSRYEHRLTSRKFKDPAKAEAFMQPLLHPKEMNISITGDTATASPYDTPIPLERQADGSWRISAIDL